MTRFSILSESHLTRRPRLLVPLVLSLGFTTASCNTPSNATEHPTSQSSSDPRLATLKLRSSAFSGGGSIPSKYTCDGDDISPPLAWSGAPDGTKTYALIVDDPDAPDPSAPKMTWVHWIVFDIPANVSGLEEDPSELPPGARQGQNDFKRTDYGGPCPPIGRHRYFFKLYALDSALDLDKPTKAQLEEAMAGHVIATGELIGTYEKQ